MNANDRPPAAYTPTVAGGPDPFAALPDAGELRRALSAYVLSERAHAIACATGGGAEPDSPWHRHLAGADEARRGAAGALAHALAAWRKSA